MVNLQIKTIHIKRHFGAEAHTSGAFQANTSIVNENFHVVQYINL